MINFQWISDLLTATGYHETHLSNIRNSIWRKIKYAMYICIRELLSVSQQSFHATIHNLPTAFEICSLKHEWSMCTSSIRNKPCCEALKGVFINRIGQLVLFLFFKFVFTVHFDFVERKQQHNELQKIGHFDFLQKFVDQTQMAFHWIALFCYAFVM